MRFILFPAFALAALAAACSNPIGKVGGPCAYESSFITGTVQSADETGILVASNEGEVFVPDEYLRAPLEVGTPVTIERQRITKGTCTPEAFIVLDPPA